MTRQILFVQGAGRSVHDEWDIKLVESLRRELGSDYELRYPRMPSEEQPQYASWKKALESELTALQPRAVLVGHSVGGTMLINVLAGQSPPQEFGALFLLAAPFIGDGGWSSDDLSLPSDLGARIARGTPIHLYHGLEDEVVPPPHLELYARAVPQARVHRLPGFNHQLNDDLHEIASAISALEPVR